MFERDLFAGSEETDVEEHLTLLPAPPRHKRFAKAQARGVFENPDLGFSPSLLVWAPLPAQRVEGSFYERQNGSVTVSIQSLPTLGLPYGRYPRLIIAYLCTQAHRLADKSGAEISLGRSPIEFSKIVGLEKGGKTATMLTDQAKKLFLTRFICVDTSIGWRARKFHVTSKDDIFWNENNPEISSIWCSSVTLSSEFVTECVEHSVPVDFNVLRQLGPLEMDMYTWLAWRLNKIDAPLRISWQSLYSQFGGSIEEKNQRFFSSIFMRRMDRINAVITTVSDATPPKYSADPAKITIYPTSQFIRPRIQHTLC